ncbi:MAG: ATP-binding protein, partial [Polyangiaceae bacterium]
DTLRTFADQVTTVAREVGFEGKLGGQAKVPRAAGTWRDLTDNVNQLAGNLTSQVRAIAEVSTAVAKGDLTRSISVEAQGEVAALKDNINQMIDNLKETTHKNQEQDWLKTNLAKFSSMMQGQRSITAVAQLIVSELTPLVDAQHGAFYMMDAEPDPELHLIASYGFGGRKGLQSSYRMKQTLVGQCAFEKKRILITEVPPDFIYIATGMGNASPRSVVVLPVLFEGDTKAVIELASFKVFTPNYLTFLSQLMDGIGVILNMISSSMRTEELLQQLKTSNAELEAQAVELNEKAKLLELKNQEVELASRNLEEKAEQLQLISKYKSEFLANMSHELRTPLNSLLILSKTLAENGGGNLTDEQVRFAQTVYTSGNDLLQLINEILDLSRVEAGKMPIDPRPCLLADVRDYIEQTFRHVAEMKSLALEVHMDPSVPASMFTDPTRLQQILKNLLSNAFKFTSKGKVALIVQPSTVYDQSISFAVEDTGIGIPADKQRLIFEAFQQADGTTSRKYGGTGLGLTISRELARLLGGSIEVRSEVGRGSTFTLHLPAVYAGAEAAGRDERPSTPSSETEIPPLPSAADFSGRTVLLVDDDGRNVFAIETILRGRNVNVLHADNGKVAVELIRGRRDIDAVLMDVMMP